METTGDILKRYMKNRIKRDTFAKLLGITPQYLSNILNDKKKPSKELLNKLVFAMEISSEDRIIIEKYEKAREKLKSYEITITKIEKEGLKSYGKEIIYSKGGKLFDTLTGLSLFVELKNDIFNFKKNDILIFEKYTDKNFDEAICICDNKLCKVRKVNKNYIVENDDVNIVKTLSIEYILVYSIRREV